MSQNNEDLNYGKKGSCFAMVIVAIILFVLLWIWVYMKNRAGLG